METFEEFKKRWDNIDKRDGSYCLFDADHKVDINIGYQKFRYRSFVIMDSGKITNLPSSHAINVENYETIDGKWVLSFTLIEEDKDEIFLKLCWDIFETSRDAEGDIIDFIIKRYILWQHMMKYQSKNILSISRQKGLIGELLYLEKLIGELGVRKAIDSWSGPDWADRDFVYDDTWAEIKTTTVSADVVSISSIEQLDVPTRGTLVIYFIDTTTNDDNSGFSLNDIIHRISPIIGRDRLSKFNFNRKLIEYGYEEKTEYDYYRFTLDRKQTYLVSDGFPRITRNQIGHDIPWAKYGISLAAIKKYEVREI